MTGGLNPLYTFANLREASEKQLTDEINHQFDLLEHQRTPALRAQLLMQELARRDQNRQTWIMIICTIAITLMTVVLVWKAC
jgi:hypothetical protein